MAVPETQADPDSARAWLSTEEDDHGPRQFDLFRSTQREAALTRLRKAMLDGDGAAATQDLDWLRQRGDLEPQLLADCRLLVAVLGGDYALVQDPPLALEWMEDELGPLALKLLGERGSVVLQHCLRTLVTDLADRPLDPANPRRHISHLWRLMNQPGNALACLEAVPDWRHDAVAMRLHALASEAAGAEPQAICDWIELCLAHPEQAEEWLSESRLLGAAMEHWLDSEPELAIDAFPAWCVLLHGLRPAPMDPNDTRHGARLFNAALALVRQGGSDTGLRRALQQLSPVLLRAYLANRGMQHP